MGMSVSLVFFFFPVLAQGKARKSQALFFLFFAVWTWNRCWLTENVKSGSHFSLFFWCLNLEQVQAYRKCGEWTALFFFFLAVWTWNRCQLTENVEGRPHFSLFFWCVWTWNRCWLTENVEREREGLLTSVNWWEWGSRCFFFFLAQGKAKKKTQALFFFFGVSEPETGAEPSLQKMWKVDRTFLFFSGLKLEQVLAELTEIVER